MPAGTDDLLFREWSGELRVRADASGEQRVIEGVVIPYGEITTVQDTPDGPRYRETIAPGAAGQIDASRVHLESLPRAPGRYNHHDGALLVGRGIAADDQDGRLAMAFRVARTRDGDELLELAREGVLTRMSASFRPIADRTRPDGVVERTQIELRRVAVVGNGAYQGAQVTAVRAAAEDRQMPEATQAAQAADTDQAAETATDDAATQPPAGGDRPNRTRVTVDVERAQAAQAEDRARAGAERETVDRMAQGAGPRSTFVQTRGEPIYGPRSQHSFLRDGFLASRGDGEASERQRRHYAHVQDVSEAIERSMSWGDRGELSRAGDVVSSEIPGAYPNDYLPGLLTPRILKGRPMGSFYDRFPIADARPRIFPKVTTSTTVAVQSAEGAALSATDFATTAVTATPLMYGAYTDVSRQAIDGADPAVQSMLLQDLLEAYAQASETVIKTAVEAGSTDSGVAITAATPYAGAIANVVNFYGTRFRPARGAFIPSAAFSTLLAQADTTGRPLVPQLGPVNSDGSVVVNDSISAPLLSAQGTLSYASTVNVWVFGVPSDFVIFESSIAQFSYDQPVGPQAVRIGIWAYLVVGTRLGSLKRTAA